MRDFKPEHIKLGSLAKMTKAEKSVETLVAAHQNNEISLVDMTAEEILVLFPLLNKNNVAHARKQLGVAYRGNFRTTKTLQELHVHTREIAELLRGWKPYEGCM